MKSVIIATALSTGLLITVISENAGARLDEARFALESTKSWLVTSPDCHGTYFNNCTKCPAGSYANDDMVECGCCQGAEGQCVKPGACTLCQAGRYQPDEGAVSCEDCKKGTSTNGAKGSSACETCQPGSYADVTGLPECKACPRGTCAPKPGAKECEQCGKGQYQNSTGKDSCAACQLGYFCKKCDVSRDTCTSKCEVISDLQDFCYKTKCTSCEPCQAGSYGNKTGLSLCVQCWKVTGSVTGSYQQNTGQDDCLPCPKGFEARTKGARNCTGCEPGSFKPSEGFELCAQCPKGSASAVVSATQCVPCAEGTYQDQPGQKECIACNVGTYCGNQSCEVCRPCEAGSEARKSGASNCTLCVPGSYKAATSASLCQMCSMGWYSREPGSKECTQCPQGFFCPQTNKGPVKCPSSSYCPPGSSSPKLCRTPFYEVDTGAMGCKATPELIALICGLLAVFLVFTTVFIVGVVRRRIKARRHSRPEAPVTDQSRLIPSDPQSAQPVYYSGL